MNLTLRRRALAELVGTAFLVMAVVGSGIAASRHAVHSCACRWLAASKRIVAGFASRMWSMIRSTGMSRSLTMRRRTATCWASFWPKNARSGVTMLSIFVTTVHTPAK